MSNKLGSLLAALALVACSMTSPATVEDGADQAPRKPTDLPDDGAAPGDAAADQLTYPDSDQLSGETSGDAAATLPPKCPACPSGQKCLSQLGVCVADGVVYCQPKCNAPLVCRLTPPPACTVRTCVLPKAFADDAIKLTSLTVAAPDATCLGGKGNALGKLASKLPLLQKLLGEAVQNDQATVLLEPVGLPGAGGLGAVRWLFGTRGPNSLKCDPASPAAYCSYTVSPLSWDLTTAGKGACRTWMELPVAWTPATQPGANGTLANAPPVAPPAGDRLQFAVPVADGGQVLLSLVGPRLQSVVVTATQGQPAGPLGWRELKGQLCASVPLTDLDAALTGLPAETLASLGGLKAAREMLAKLLPADVDVDADGTPDAASAILDFSGVRAKIVGLSPQP